MGIKYVVSMAPRNLDEGATVAGNPVVLINNQ
jgi:hypothetical protein